MRWPALACGVTSAADSIRARREQSNAAIAAHDAAAVVAIMAGDVTVAVAGGPVLSGREASRLAFAEQMAEPGFKGYVRTPDVVEVAPDGCAATERGRWVGRWQVRLRLQERHGTYVATWRRVNDAWCIASEIFSDVTRRELV